MITKITTIEGLGGTGKTHEINQIALNRTSLGRNVTYVTFNRNTAIEMRNRNEASGVSISTIHGLAYRELKAVGKLPERFMGTIDEQEPNASPKAFEELMEAFMDHLAYHGQSGDDIERTLIVDEYQNVSADLKKAIALICSKGPTELVLAGDRYQSIYRYLDGHEENNFDVIKRDFERAPDERIILNKNHRSNPSTLAVVNGFMDRNFRIKNDMKYEIDQNAAITPQIVAFFTNREGEFEYVKEEATRFHEESGKKVVILARACRSLSLFLAWKDESPMDWLIVSTIHSYIGNAAPMAFIVGFELTTTDDEAMTIYTGLIRAEESITITSSFPAFDVSLSFDPMTITVLDRQKRIGKPYRNLKLIKPNRNLTRGKFKASMIDSITLTVTDDDLPFVPYFESHGIDASPFTRSYITKDEVPIRIGRHCGKDHVGIFFELKDVNLLRANDYTDAQTIKYLTNKVLEYFNYQVTIDHINLHSIDLCKIVEADDALIQLLMDDGLEYASRLDHYGDPVERFTLDAIKDRTVYHNFTGRNTKSTTLATYRPIDKRNKNRYFDPKAIKLELRYKRAGIRAKGAFGTDMTVKTLLQGIKENETYLEDTFMATIEARKRKAK
jgi:hypothetical protein